MTYKIKLNKIQQETPFFQIHYLLLKTRREGEYLTHPDSACLLEPCLG